MESLTIPLMIILLSLAFIIVLRVIASRYKKIPPNAVGIFYGRKYPHRDSTTGAQQVLGFKVVGGGGRVVIPFVESYQEMSTAAFQTEIDERGIPNKDNVQINVKGVATCKISNVPEDLVNAAQAFLRAPAGARASCGTARGSPAPARGSARRGRPSRRSRR